MRGQDQPCGVFVAVALFCTVFSLAGAQNCFIGASCESCYQISGCCWNEILGFCGRQGIDDCTLCPQPIDCTWTPWGNFEPCTALCEQAGTMTRRRSINTPAENGGSCPGLDTDTQPCTGPACPVNCQWSQWTDWSTCIGPCDRSGYKERTRTKTVVEANGGTCLGDDGYDETPCSTDPCPVNCVWGAWTSWAGCTAPCGGSGDESRSRSIATQAANGGQQCTGPFSETRPCPGAPCPIPCTYNQWSTWTACNAPCESSGTKTRDRTKNAEQYGGAPCTEPLTESTPCTGGTCPVNCVWSLWTTWSSCTAPCDGTASITRTRFKNGPTGSGADCVGPNSETSSCNGSPCPPSPIPLPSPSPPSSSLPPSSFLPSVSSPLSISPSFIPSPPPPSRLSPSVLEPSPITETSAISPSIEPTFIPTILSSSSNPVIPSPISNTECLGAKPASFSFVCDKGVWVSDTPSLIILDTPLILQSGSFEVPGSISVEGSQTLFVISSSLSLTGTLKVANGGKLNVQGSSSSTELITGTLQLSNDSTVSVSTTSSSATIKVTSCANLKGSLVLTVRPTSPAPPTALIPVIESSCFSGEFDQLVVDTGGSCVKATEAKTVKESGLQSRLVVSLKYDDTSCISSSSILRNPIVLFALVVLASYL